MNRVKRIFAVGIMLMLLFSFSACQKVEQKIDRIVLELGEEFTPELSDYLDASDKAAAECVIDSSCVDTMTAGEYEMTISYKEQIFIVAVIVEDTTEPEVVVADEEFKTIAGYTISTKDVIISAEDLAGIASIAFAKNVAAAPVEGQIDMTDEEVEEVNPLISYVLYEEEGEYENAVIVTDTNGNQTVVEIIVKVAEDYTRHAEVEAFTVVEGSEPDWLAGITYDQRIISVDCDYSDVDIDIPGEYKIIYTIHGDDEETSMEMETTVTVAELIEETQETSNISDTENTANTGSNSGGNGTAAASAVQTGLAGYLQQSSLNSKTDQVLCVVASGTAAQITLMEKSGDQWSASITTSGYVGSQGIGQASEYVSRTPYGAYTLGFAFGTGGNPGTLLPYRQITANSYWISNPDDPQYNTWQERDSSSSMDEHLLSYGNAYKYAIVINYNGGYAGGSAFFLHVSTGGPTAGCVSVPESAMLQFMKTIHSGAYIVNVTSEAQIANL